MGKFLTAATVSLALLVPAAAGAQGLNAYGSDQSRIQRPEEKAEPPEPIARKAFDGAVETMFRAADTDRNGVVALAEFNAAIEARKSRAIAERFAAVDADRNRSISFAEFGAWQRAMGSAALSDTAGAGLGAYVGEELPPELDSDREGRVLARLIVPLSAVVLVNANTDYDGGASLAELLAWEGKRFDEADVNDDGWLVFDEYDKLLRGPEDQIAAARAR